MDGYGINVSHNISSVFYCSNILGVLIYMSFYAVNSGGAQLLCFCTSEWICCFVLATLVSWQLQDSCLVVGGENRMIMTTEYFGSHSYINLTNNHKGELV